MKIKSVNCEALLDQFLEEWDELVKLGHTSPFDGVEISSMLIFAHWLNDWQVKHEKDFS